MILTILGSYFIFIIIYAMYQIIYVCTFLPSDIIDFKLY